MKEKGTAGSKGSGQSSVGTVLITFGVIALIIAVFFSFFKASEESFLKALPSWAEVEGSFTDFHLANSGTRLESDDEGGRNEYRWWVRFDYTLEFLVDGQSTLVPGNIERSGYSDYNMIPDTAMEPPYYTGESTLLVFDPANPSIHELGSMEEVRAVCERRYERKPYQ